MRKLAANIVFTCNSNPIKFGCVVVDDDGTIIDIIDNNGHLVEEEGLEYYNGVIVPGFIVANTTAAADNTKNKQLRFKSGVQLEFDNANILSYNTRDMIVNQMFDFQSDGASFADALA